jgi:hypothetical protein
MTEKIFPNDTQWAIAASLPASVLESVRKQLPKALRGKGSRVVAGPDGFAALLVFGGAADLGESLAAALSTKSKSPVFVLDFDDEAPAVMQFDGAKEKHRGDDPAEFLEQRGIVAPGDEPSEPSGIVTIGVVDKTTVAEARKVVPKGGFQIIANSRGIAVEDVSGMISGWIGEKLGRPAYTLFLKPDGAFRCLVFEPGKEPSAFGQPSPNWRSAESVLGETTLEGIVRVLDIPAPFIEAATRFHAARQARGTT